MRDSRISCLRSADLQRHDPVAMEFENVIEVHRATGKIARHPSRNDRLAVSFGDAERLDGAMVIFAGLAPPRLDRGDAFDRPSLVAHECMGGEAAICTFGVTGVLRCKVDLDRWGEMNGHRSSSWLRKVRASTGRIVREARCGGVTR